MLSYNKNMRTQHTELERLYEEGLITTDEFKKAFYAIKLYVYIEDSELLDIAEVISNG